ncbi:MAG: S8 family serine peptidase [Deltaproteobacteria bacterium]|nr:S8 family serine peptidase [Deltaproteobacteria bacterium]
MDRKPSLFQTALVLCAVVILGALPGMVFCADAKLIRPQEGFSTAAAGSEIFHQYIVRLRSGKHNTYLAGSRIANRVGARLLRTLNHRAPFVLIEKPFQRDSLEFLEALQNDPEVLNVEPNAPVSIPDPHPNEVYISSSPEAKAGEALHADDPYLTWGYADIEADLIPPCPASAPVVAVLDTGVDYNHPELAGRVILGMDFYNDDEDPMDDHGHGTHVSGIIAAEANNGMGSAGVADKAKILAIKVLGENGYGSTWNVIQGIYAAADHPDVRVINLSLSTMIGTRSFGEALDYAISKGILIVAAAGNNNSNDNYHYPARWAEDWDGLLAVAANDRSGCKASFSNYGHWVSISAPGVDIFSTLPGNRYGSWSGTSMATPFVAGAAARLLAANPGLTNVELNHIIEAECDILMFDDICWPNDGSNFGNLNLARALNEMPEQPWDNEPPRVEILAPVNDGTYTSYEPLLNLSGTASDNVEVVRVAWSNDSDESGEAAGTTSWEIEGLRLREGENQIRITAYDQVGNQGTAEITVSYFPEGTFSLNVRVSEGESDSLEKEYNGLTLPDYARAYVGKGYINGFHFKDVAIPQGAVILSANLDLHCWGFCDKDISIVYLGEAADDAAPFTRTLYDLSSRPMTSSSVHDRPASWSKDSFNTSADLKDIIQEIVDRDGWYSGSSLNLFIFNNASSAYRRLSVFEQGEENAAVLRIRFKVDTDPVEDTEAPEVTISEPTQKTIYRTSLPSIKLNGTASDNVFVEKVIWSTDRGESGTAEGTDTWEIHSIPLKEGVNIVTVTAEDKAGNQGHATLEVLFEPDEQSDEPVTLAFKILNPDDDAYEKTYNGSVSRSSKTMYLGKGYINGFRFEDVQIPSGATILSAVLKLHVRLYGDRDITLRFVGESTARPEPFSNTRFVLSDRLRTSAEVIGSIEPWTEGEYNASPDISDIIQEIVNLPSWEPGSSLTLFIEDWGSSQTRMAQCFEMDPALSAVLEVRFKP